jgi:hypothetical protein
MSGRNALLAAHIARTFGLSATEVEESLDDSVYVGLRRDDITAVAAERGISLDERQVSRVMDAVASRFDPDGAGLSYAAVDAAIDEVVGGVK